MQLEETKMAHSLVLLPTYNEAANLEPMVEAILRLTDADVLVIDDNSPDGTGDLAEALRMRHQERVHTLHRARKEGLGRALAAGFELALAWDYAMVFQMDADFSHSPEDLPRLAAALRAGADVAIGSRYVAGGASPGLPWHRHLLSRAGSRYAAAILRLPVHDMTGGFKGFSRLALRTIQPRTLSAAGFAVQIETTYRAYRAGMAVHEVPIVFHDRRAGESKMTRRIVVEGLLLPWRIRQATGVRRVPATAAGHDTQREGDLPARRTNTP
jgi:dolichol-phosphate mannosyltransferase